MSLCIPLIAFENHRAFRSGMGLVSEVQLFVSLGLARGSEFGRLRCRLLQLEDLFEVAQYQFFLLLAFRLLLRLQLRRLLS